MGLFGTNVFIETDAVAVGTIVESNQASLGAGIYAIESTIDGFDINNNVSLSDGGGVILRESHLINCIVRNNSAERGGGDLCSGVR